MILNHICRQIILLFTQQTLIRVLNDQISIIDEFKFHDAWIPPNGTNSHKWQHTENELTKLLLIATKYIAFILINITWIFSCIYTSQRDMRFGHTMRL